MTTYLGDFIEFIKRADTGLIATSLGYGLKLAPGETLELKITRADGSVRTYAKSSAPLQVSI